MSKMSQLRALLITSMQDTLPVSQYFPLNLNDNRIITELLIIAKHLKKCGKGCFQLNNGLFYYKTYIPNLVDAKEGNSSENLSMSKSFSDYFIYSFDCNKKSFFLLYYCEKDYKQQDIDNLTNDIFEILDGGAFEGHKLKQTSRDAINKIFTDYQKKKPRFKAHNLLSNVEESSINNSKIKEDKLNRNKTPKKRCDSRFIGTMAIRTKTGADVSEDIDEITSMKNFDSNFSSMFKYSFNDETYNYKSKDLRKIKIWNLISFIIFLLMTTALFILFYFFVD